MCYDYFMCLHCTVALFSDSLLPHPPPLCLPFFFPFFFKRTNRLSAHPVCLISPYTWWHSVTHYHTCTLCQQYHPSKHAGSSLDQGGSIGQKRARCFLHTGLLPDQIHLAKTWQPELNQIRLVLHNIIQSGSGWKHWPKWARCFLHTGLLPDRIHLAKTWRSQN